MGNLQLPPITQLIQRLHSAQCLFFQQHNTKAAAHQFSESFQELSTLPPQTQEDLKLTECLKLFTEGFVAWCEAATIYFESYFYIEASEAYQRAASKFESFLSSSHVLGLNSMEIYAKGLAKYCFALSQRSLELMNRNFANFRIASCYASEAATSCAKAGEFFNTLAGQEPRDKISQQLISDDLVSFLCDEMCVMHELELAEHYYVLGLTFERKGKRDEAINNYSRSKEYVEKCLNRVREKFGAFTYWGDIESLTSRLHDCLVSIRYIQDVKTCPFITLRNLAIRWIYSYDLGLELDTLLKEESDGVKDILKRLQSSLQPEIPPYFEPIEQDTFHKEWWLKFRPVAIKLHPIVVKSPLCDKIESLPIEIIVRIYPTGICSFDCLTKVAGTFSLDDVRGLADLGDNDSSHLYFEIPGQESQRLISLYEYITKDLAGKVKDAINKQGEQRASELADRFFRHLHASELLIDQKPMTNADEFIKEYRNEIAALATMDMNWRVSEIRDAENVAKGALRSDSMILISPTDPTCFTVLNEDIDVIEDIIRTLEVARVMAHSLETYHMQLETIVAGITEEILRITEKREIESQVLADKLIFISKTRSKFQQIVREFDPQNITPWYFCLNTLERLNHLQYHLSRRRSEIFQGLEEMTNISQLLYLNLEEGRKKREEALNKTLRRLTIIATLFIPLNLLVGFFGMNFTLIPWGSRLLFFITLLTISTFFLGIILWLVILWLKKKG